VKKYKYLITGLLFLVVSLGLIFSSKLNILLFPTTEVDLRGGFDYGTVIKDYVFVQELPVQKNYLSAIDLVLFSPNVQYRNDNTILVLDTAFHILFQRRFTNEGLDKPQYVTFKFPESVYVGKGNKVLLAISSTNGEKDNFLALPKKQSGISGKFYVRAVENNDVVGTLRGGTGQVIPIGGNLCLRTYETDTPGTNGSKTGFSLVAVLISLLIIFTTRIKALLLRTNLIPEYAFASLALIFGLILVFVTPPLQVPDENQHYFRSYQIAEFKFFKYAETIPASLKQVADSVQRLNFGLFEKMGPKDRESLSQIKLMPENRIQMATLDYIVPFLPQGLGMMVGRIVGASPLSLIYFGRIGNLLVSILLIFFAIRAIPVSKWLLFLLALMPMTLYQMASLSYDVPTLGLTFLLIALILKYALMNRDIRLPNKELGLLFLIIFLLGLCKPPYALVGLLFLVLPVKRLGNLTRFLVVFILFMTAALSGSQLWTIRNLLKPAPPVANVQPTISIQQAALILPTGTIQTAVAPQQSGVAQPAVTDAATQPATQQAAPPDQTKADSRCDPVKQKAYILEDPFRYLSMLYKNTFVNGIRFYLETFVGQLGWLNLYLPAWLINFYLFVLLFAALVVSTGDFRLGIPARVWMAAVFFLGIFLIETAMYLYWTPVGQGFVEGVQGRYFIPLSPLLFLALSFNLSERVVRYFNNKNSGAKVKNQKGKKPIQKVAAKPDIAQPLLLTKNLYACSFILFTFVILTVTVYFVVSKYYFITI